MQPSLNASRVIFIDEAAATTKMTTTHGYAPQGQRLVKKVPPYH